MIRRLSPFALALAALLSLSSGAAAQLSPGIHVARAADVFGGANGVGASLQLGFPLLPFDAFVAGEYFFPDCTEADFDDCHYWGGSADVHFTMPVPLLTPYGSAGLVWRSHRDRDGDLDTTSTNVGFGLGAGVDLNAIALGAYAEVRYEIVDPDDQFVFRIGLRF